MASLGAGQRTGMSEADDQTRLVAAGDTAPGGGVGMAPGTLLSHTYRIENLLARGGMGEIYRARHASLGTEHAIKIMLPELAKDQKVIDLFTREAAVLRNVRNEAVVGYDGVVCDQDGHLYLIMEFVDGPQLGEVLKKGPLTPDEVRLLRDRLAMGLGAAHEKGVIHRDMSPDNVILPGGRLENAKIIDFGIAKLADPDVRTVIGGDFAGKYSFASPEQLGMHGGHVDARSDIYSAGLVLAAAAIGKPLDMGSSHVAVLEARRTVPDLDAVPASLRDEIAWMLEPDPDDRPQSMADLLAGKGRPTAHGAGAKTGATPKSKLGLIAVVVAVVVAIGGGVGGYLLLGGGETPVPDPDEIVVATAPPTGGGTGTTAPLVADPLTPGPAVDPLTPGPAPDPLTPRPGGVDPLTPPQPATGTGMPPLPAAPGDQVASLPDRAFIDREVGEILSGFECANLSATLTDDLQIMVTGYLSADADLQRLVRALSSVQGIRGVIESASIRPWPFCAAIGVLEAQASLAPGQPGRPGIQPNNPSLVYEQGDLLIVTASATRLYDGYLYVDFIDKEGNVYHLFPTETRRDNRSIAGQEVLVGGGPGGFPGDLKLEINPPYGTDMLVAISAPTPLFAGPRRFDEKASPYLQVLSERLTAIEREGHANPPIANYLFINSRPRG
ncbi:MAG: protein kinase [Inquilinus sp.]|nr:protein kinase [Inquilinus sp.]